VIKKERKEITFRWRNLRGYYEFIMIGSDTTMKDFSPLYDLHLIE